MIKALFAVVAITAAVSPSSAATKPPALGKSTTITSVGSRAMQVTIAKHVRLEGRSLASMASWTTGGLYGGFLLQEAGPGKWTWGTVALDKVFGCPIPNSLAAQMGSCSTVQAYTAGAKWLNPGIYTLYVLAEAGKSITLRFTMPELSGRNSLAPVTPVRSWLGVSHETIEGADVAAVDFPGVITTPRPFRKGGYLFHGAWAAGYPVPKLMKQAPFNMSQDAYTHYQCLGRGVRASPNTCGVAPRGEMLAQENYGCGDCAPIAHLVSSRSTSQWHVSFRHRLIAPPVGTRFGAFMVMMDLLAPLDPSWGLL